MNDQDVKSTFQYCRMAGSLHHSYRVEIRGLAYRISLGRRFVRRSAAGMLKMLTSMRPSRRNDIEQLVGIEDE